MERVRHGLRHGKHQAGLREIAALPRRSSAVGEVMRREQNYFASHARRMNYQPLARRGWQNHGDGLKLRSIKDIVNYKNDGNDLWLWTLESVLKSNKKAIQSAKEEVSFLSDFFRKNPDVKYVALEALPATSLDHLKYSEKVRDDLLAESSRRKVSNFLTMPHVLGFAGSAVYLKMTEPGLMKNRVFFGVESEKEVDAHAKLVSRYDDTLSSLKKQVDQPSLEGQDFLQKLDRTEGKLIVLYPTYNSNLDKQILEAALLKTPDKYKKATSDWISASLDNRH